MTVINFVPCSGGSCDVFIATDGKTYRFKIKAKIVEAIFGKKE